MSRTYTKLFRNILTSTVWQEDNTTRIVWITLLSLADQNGIVDATVPGLANMANVTVEECEQALQKFMSKDRYSRSKEHQGRRIEAVDGGWRLLNYAKYRSIGQTEDRREYIRKKVQEHRAKKQQGKQAPTDVNNCKQSKHKNKNKNKNNNNNNGQDFLKIFNHWNSYKGKLIEKNNEKITWKSHNLKSDGFIAPEIVKAIKQALSVGYSVEDICSAISNYAKILLGEDFFWTYAWNLAEFLTRGEERHKQAPRKWWKFLPDNFDKERYLSEGARLRRNTKARGPTPYQLAIARNGE